MSEGKSYICRDCAKHSLLESKCQECNSPRILKLDDLLSLKIAHIDCDAFYASVEKSQNPNLINKPVIVGGGQRGVVTTCCYIARIKGIKSAMPIFKAKKLCPEAIIIPPRMSLYKHVSNLIFKKFYRLTPSVETIAFDEAYLDFSGTYQVFFGLRLIFVRQQKSDLLYDHGLSDRDDHVNSYYFHLQRQKVK